MSRRRRGSQRAPDRAAHPSAPGAPDPVAAARRHPAPVSRAAPSASPILIAAALVVATGIVLRLVRIGAGLPDFLDEAMPWKAAFQMWVDERRVDWNPHFFDYPTLTIYLSLFLQKLAFALGHALGRYPTAGDFLIDYEMDPTALVIAARTMWVALEALTLVMTVRIGERLGRGAGVVAAALVALSPTLIGTSRAMYTDTFMTGFSVWALERMLAFRGDGRRSQLIAAAVLTGLATGSKYPAALLVVPLVWVVFERRGWRGFMPLALACAVAAGVFLVTSPFVALDFVHFRKAIRFLGFHISAGHLGNADRRGFLFQLRTLAADLGWIGAALLPVSLGVAIARRQGDRLTLWLFLIPIGLAISLVRVEAGRYLAPALPVAAALAAVAGLDLARRFGGARPGLANAAIAAALVLPVAPAGIAAALNGRDDTQVETRRWCEANLPDSSLILRESYTGNLFTRQRAAALVRTGGFRTASPDRQRRFLARRRFDAAELPLIAAGDVSVVLEGPDSSTRRLPVFADPTAINRIFYDVRVLHGVDYVITSGAARGRYQADTARFAAQAGFYRFLDRNGEHVASFRSGRGVSGPDVDIYRIGEQARDEIVRRGPLHPLWWAESVPPTFRREYEELVVEPARRSGGALMRDGAVAPWVLGLSEFFDQDVRPFTMLLGWELANFDRFDSAAPLLEAIHVMHADDVGACLAYARCAAALERWPAVEAAASSTKAAARDSSGLDELSYLQGLALARLGRKSDALRELEWARDRAEPGSDLRAAAEAEVRRLGGDGR
jgi:dolichyl-phosphate-mannose-protein mannosyltransferase